MQLCFSFCLKSIGGPAAYFAACLPLTAALLPSPTLGSVTSPSHQGLQQTAAQSRTALPPNQEQMDPRLATAKSLLQKNMPADAERAVREYLFNHSDSADGYFLLGEILFREIQAAERSNANTTIVGILHAADPGSDGGKTSKANESLAAYTAGAKYRQPGAFELKIIALDYVLLGDYPDADKWLTRSLQWDPADADGWYNLGRTKYNENRFADAVEAFQHCLKLEPKNVKAADNLGLSYAALSRKEEAIAAYENAIELQSNLPFKNPGPFIDLGSLYVDLNQFAEALPYLLQAVRIAPLEAKAHEQLGKAYSGLNQSTQARSELEKATELSPGSASLHFLLGQIYRKEGLTEKAKIELDRAAALSGAHSVSETPRP